MRLAYLGPPGTFGEEAAIAADPDAERIPYPSHVAVAGAVESGEADEGIVAIENSISGSVAETLDIFVHDDTGLRIQREVVVPVRHCLVLPPGVERDDVAVVYSHPQVFGQCRRFLEACLPEVQREAALSTVEAVQLALGRGGDAGAIANERAAELYGANVSERDIQDTENNVTRFVVLGRGETRASGRDRTSVALWFDGDRPGLLVGVLTELAARSINCSKLESRPTRAAFGEYVFLIDFLGHVEDPVVREAMEAIRAQCADMKVFGSYPRWS